MNNYFELHNHSHFSYLDGISSPKDMAKKAKEFGYPALAITDHGNIDGWYNFYSECRKQDIQPILSCEFYVARNIDDKEQNPFKKEGEEWVKRKHLIVHAKTDGGVEALREIYNNSWFNFKLKGGKQIVFEEDLMKHAGKILIQSACIGSYVTSDEIAIRFKEAFGDDFYLEIQPHTLEHDYSMEDKNFVPCEDKQALHNHHIINLAKKTRHQSYNYWRFSLPE